MLTTVGRWGWGTGLAACCLWSTIGTAMAQQKQPAAGTTAPAARQQPAQNSAQNMDAEFAACLVLANQNEIVASRLAEERSESNHVKKFARMLQADHAQFVTDLEKFGGQQFRNRIKDQADARSEDRRSELEGRDNQSKDAYGKTGTQREAVTAATPAAHGNAHLQIHEEIADECLASTRRELSDRKGREFDACYVGMQIAAHMRMVDELKVLERHASREMQPVLQKGRKAAEEHLLKAKELMKDLEKDHDTRTAKRPDSN
jgi:predicted outer membrane protein